MMNDALLLPLIIPVGMLILGLIIFMIVEAIWGDAGGGGGAE